MKAQNSEALTFEPINLYSLFDCLNHFIVKLKSGLSFPSKIKSIFARLRRRTGKAGKSAGSGKVAPSHTSAAVDIF